MKQKVFGILLLFSFVAPVVVTFIFLQIKKEMAKEEVIAKMVSGIEKDQLVLLKFTRAAADELLDWEHSKEFEYCGDMYDVVDTEHYGDTTYYWCWEDNKETKLNAQLDKLIANALGEDPENRKNQKRINTFLKSLYYTDMGDIVNPLFREITLKHSSTADPFQSIQYSPPVPPPRIA